mgnify:CR=1 FL=1
MGKWFLYLEVQYQKKYSKVRNPYSTKNFRRQFGVTKKNKHRNMKSKTLLLILILSISNTLFSQENEKNKR